MPRNVLSRTVLILLSTILAAISVELVLRVFYKGPLTTFPNFVEQRLDLIRRVSGPIKHDELLGWALKDNFQAPGSFRFSTGFMGLRQNSDEHQAPLKGAILAVGDSFTAGSGVQDHETWPAHLEKRLGEPVYNGAGGGWGVDQIVLRAEQLISHLEPHTLIVSILAQDSLRNNFDLYGGAYKPYFVLEGGSLRLAGIPVPKIERKPITIGPFRRILGYSFTLDWTTNRLGYTALWASDALASHQFAENSVGVEVSCRLMDRLFVLGERHRTRIVVMIQYAAQEAMGSPAPWYGPPVLECANQRGFLTIDKYGPLNRLASADHDRFTSLWLNEGGQLGHMSSAGNDFIAESVFEALKH